MKISIDSNVFISALSKEAHSASAQHLLQDVAKGEHKAAASSIIYSEVLKESQGSGFESDLAEYLSLIENLTTMPASDEICIKAGNLRLKYGSKLKMPDALHLATAMAAKADVFVTNDKELAAIGQKILPTKSLEKF